ncbi:MAG: acyl-CoA dehydrogenase family protein, partial [Methyloligellaceae bacterium]
MDFGLSEEQSAIYDMAHGFAMENLAPNATQWDETGTFPVDVMREAAALGMGGLYVREDAGGSNLSRLDATLIFEALAHGCPTIAAYMSIHNMCAWMVDRFASDEIRAAWLPKLCAMESLTSYCLTEPGVGSDAAALTSRASRDNENYTLNGAKVFISGAGVSDLYIVMVRTGAEGPDGITSILVPGDASGLSFGALEKKMGWNAQPTATVQLDDVVVPMRNRLGEEGDGFKIAMQALDGGRLNIAACSLGAAQAALDKTVTYLNERKAFGKTLADLQA